MAQIRDIIQNTRRSLTSYWKKTLEQRLVNGAGSRFNIASAEELERLLLELDWLEYNHPSIKAPARGYKASLPPSVKAWLGVVRLDSLDSETRVKLDDRKGTSKVSALVEQSSVNAELLEVDYVVLLVGPHPEDPGLEVVWTFHPGPPIRPSEVPASSELVNKVITAREALELGLEWAKLVDKF